MKNGRGGLVWRARQARSTGSSRKKLHIVPQSFPDACPVSATAAMGHQKKSKTPKIQGIVYHAGRQHP
jgi:hypothetical protein